MRNIGRELLWGKADERNWRPEQLERNSLGYENWQLLLIFSYNTPTATLPIFWSNGIVNIGGDFRKWIPLFPRYPQK